MRKRVAAVFCYLYCVLLLYCKSGFCTFGVKRLLRQSY